MKFLLLRLIRLFGALWCRMRGAELAASALVHGLPRVSCKPGGRIVLEDGATLNCTLWSNPLNDGRRTVLFAGPGACIRLCQDAGISSARLIAYRGILIGRGSLIGAGSLLCDSDMHEVPLGCGAPVRSAPIVIGSNVFIGAGSTILKGVTIGDGAVIGARSVVCSDIPSGVLAAGNPAKVIRPL